MATEEQGAGGGGEWRRVGGTRPSGEPPRFARLVGSERRGGQRSIVEAFGEARAGGV